MVFVLAMGNRLIGQTPDSAATEISIVLKTFIEKSTIPQNQKFSFNIELSWIGDISRYQIVSIPQPGLENLVLEGSGSANRQDVLPDGRQRSTKTIMYDLVPVSMGPAVIHGVEVLYRDTISGRIESLRSQPVYLTIVEPLADVKGGLKGIIYVLLLGAFGITVLYFVIMFFKNRKNRRLSDAQTQTTEAIFLERIALEIDPKGMNLNEMFLRLWHIFREYLATVFPQGDFTESQNAMNQLLANGVEMEAVKKLEPFFQKIDMIKFGGDSIDPLMFANLRESVEKFMQNRQTNDAKPVERG